MEETTSWKNHSFTLLIFGGIVVLCSIFFVLGMLVGRNQGKRIAEMAYAEQEENKPVATTVTDEFKLSYYSEATEDEPQSSPEPPPTASISAPVTSGASTTARPKAKEDKAAAAPRPAETRPQAAAKPPAARTPAPDSKPPEKTVLLQITSTKNEKQAQEELKKVESNGFKPRMHIVTLKNVRWHRVVVGPYRESEVNVAMKNLKAKGYSPVRAQQ